MKFKRITLLLLSLFLLISGFSRNNNNGSKFLSEKQAFSKNISGNNLNIGFAVQSINVSVKQFESELFTVVSIDEFGSSYNQGEPDLPELCKLIYVPKNIKLSLQEVTHINQEFNLTDSGFINYIKPAINSLSKSNANQNKVLTKGEVYKLNKFTDQPVVELKQIGLLNETKVYELIFKPCSYNPVQNTLKIRNEVEVQLSWDNKEFNSEHWDFFNEPAQIYKTYAIVAPLMYKQTLKPFIKWKRQMGYQVIEAYIGEQIASNNKNDIKAFLRDQYLTPNQGFKPLSYLLIVGDVHQIPTWQGETEPHATDLYYAEFTNDYLPDAYYGRISVADTIQLKSVINKTLWVEKGRGVHNNNYKKHLLVSGVDADFAPKFGNGAINYLLNYYSNQKQNIEPIYYLYGSGSPITSGHSLARSDILNKFSMGAGIVYYTAHCDISGWSDPMFSLNDIDGLSNLNMYPLMISNCCESLMFNKNSFGEQIVRAKNKGAVAYIGATNYSYWDEDYYWGIGLTSDINANPKYEQTGMGAFDAWFHTHNEPIEEHANTVSEILQKGNLAVQSSSSKLKKYYWEVYQIMGDPSLVPVKNEYQKIQAQYESIIKTGVDFFNVQSEANATVSLSYNDQIIGLGKSDESGSCFVEIEPIKTVGSKLIELVISKPGYFPLIDSIDVQPSDGPFVMFKSVLVSDSLYGNANHEVDYGETLQIKIEMKNFGSEKASEVTCNLSTNSTWVSNKELVFDFNDIEANGSAVSVNECILKVNDNAPNNIYIQYNGYVVYGGTDSSKVNFNIKVNAPEIELANYMVDESGKGNADGVIDNDEVVTLDLDFVNIANAQVSNTLIEFSAVGDSKFEVLDGFISGLIFNANELQRIKVNIKGDADFFNGEKATLKYSVQAGAEQQYFFDGEINLVLGITPEYNMQSAEKEVVSAYFYDSGGKDENYKDSEEYLLTFKPHYENEGLKVDFLNFGVEQMTNEGCYDYLTIYNGIDEQSPVIGEFCSWNFEETIVSQNEHGALTFKFYSDHAINEAGWEAVINSHKQHTVTVKLTDGIDVIEGASVQLGHATSVTNSEGEVKFSFVLSEGKKIINVFKQGYIPYAEELASISKDTIVTLLVHKTPGICFAVFHETQAVEFAQVVFDNDTTFTDSEGNANFYNIEPGLKKFIVTANGYIDTVGVINVGNIDACYQIGLRKDLSKSINQNTDLKINVYPNPLHNGQSLKVISSEQVKQVKLFNYQGRLLVTKMNQPKEFMLELSNIKEGIYILQFKVESGYYFEKLIVK